MGFLFETGAGTHQLKTRCATRRNVGIIAGYISAATSKIFRSISDEKVEIVTRLGFMAEFLFQSDLWKVLVEGSRLCL
jgi:hypothetical protein